MNWLVCVPGVHNDVTLTVYVYNVFVFANQNILYLSWERLSNAFPFVDMAFNFYVWFTNTF